jgi:hypothetical protein
MSSDPNLTQVNTAVIGEPYRFINTEISGYVIAETETTQRAS